jgi:hypothetical protein
LPIALGFVLPLLAPGSAEWLDNHLFRVGASSLLTDIERQVVAFFFFDKFRYKIVV